MSAEAVEISLRAIMGLIRDNKDANPMWLEEKIRMRLVAVYKAGVAHGQG